MLLLLICGFIGFLVGGLRGFFFGALIGYALSRVAQTVVRRRLRSIQVHFLDTTFAVMGAVCKADGVVTRDEIRVTEQLFDQLRLSVGQRDSAKAAFTRGKSADFDLDAAVDQFAQAARGNTTLFQLFLQVQLLAVSADGEVHPAEHDMIVRVARRLGLTDLDVARLEALLRAAARGAPGVSSGPPPQQRLDDAYAAFGLSPEASVTEIKHAYRKLMLENHPDKLAAKGLPENMRAIAEERAREINAAYDLLKQARQFT